MQGAGAGGVKESLVRAVNMVREVHAVKGTRGAWCHVTVVATTNYGLVATDMNITIIKPKSWDAHVVQ